MTLRPSLSAPTLAILILTLPVLAPAPLSAQPGLWESELHGLTEVHLEKRSARAFANGEADLHLPRELLYKRLPPDVVAQLGSHAVEYDAFTVTRLPGPAAEKLVSTAAAHGLGFRVAEEHPIKLSWHRFTPGDAVSRVPAAAAAHVDPAPIPGLYLAQFAYPIQRPWVDELVVCGAEEVAYFEGRTFLLRAADETAITDCPASRYLSWVGDFHNTDRIDPQLLVGAETRDYELQYLPGTDLNARAAELAAFATVDEVRPHPDGGTGYLRVTASPADLRRIVASDPDLLSVTPGGRDVLSDEQQGQIVAGNYTAWGVPYSGYYSWLSSRGLLTSSNPQAVVVIDLGFDDGKLAENEHHPDLRHPDASIDRLTFLKGYGWSSTLDNKGHGTMVAGIVAGYGHATGAKDSFGLHYGSGVAPHTRLYATSMASFDNQYVQAALSDSLATSLPASIANHSWNLAGGSQFNIPINKYEPRARFLDERVFDANSSTTAWEPMSMVVSAGNFRDTCNDHLEWDTVSSPATAKNVITVGATSTYRPEPNPPRDCRSCTETTNYGRPKEHNALNIADVADFSSRGRQFVPAPGTPRALYTRIKPDVVAPGNRVFSTVPHKTAGTTYSSYDIATAVSGCTKYHPTSPAVTYHTYGAGTSFAAPVVSGVAALARKWLADRGTNASPALVKAALIATADDLGGQGNNGGDHRPSPRYGWGRVSLERLTDGQARFLQLDFLSTALTTGESISWTRTIGNGNVDTYITMVWTDKPTALDGDSQAALVNDLSLKVNAGAYRGNAFNETMSTTEDGYSFYFNVCACPQDNINNVESIFIPAGTFSTGQAITITATGENVPQPIGSYGQPFALYAYNVQ